MVFWEKMKRFYISIFILGLIVISAAAVLVYRYEFNSSGVYQARLIINNKEFSVEIADTSVKQAQGLSGRQSLATNQGMLFIFERPGIYGFWMKDMKFPIDIIWIKNNRIIGFEKNIPSPASQDMKLPVYYPVSEADRVLEVVAGTADKYKFMVGDEVKVL